MRLTKKQIYQLLAGILIIVLGAVCIWWIVSSKPAPEVASPQTTVKIDAPVTVTYTAKKDKSVLEQLKSGSDVIVKESTYGKYVESINGYKAGTDGKYWTYFVNGKMGEVGADAYITKGGEVVEWKFQK